MVEDSQAAERRRRGLPPGIDPRNYDPRRMVDPATRERMARAQVAARAQAQAATTVTIATVVSLVTSAFTFVAGFAWNSAVQALFDQNAFSDVFGFRLSQAAQRFVYAIFVTLIAVVVVVMLNRFARRIAVKSAIDTAQSLEG